MDQTQRAASIAYLNWIGKFVQESEITDQLFIPFLYPQVHLIKVEPGERGRIK